MIGLGIWAGGREMSDHQGEMVRRNLCCTKSRSLGDMCDTQVWKGGPQGCWRPGNLDLSL